MSGIRLLTYGSFYYQSFFLNANTTGVTGTFAPGSLAISNFNPSAASYSGVSALHLRAFAGDFPDERSSLRFHVPGWPRAEWHESQHSAALHRVVESWYSAASWAEPSARSTLRGEPHRAAVAQHKPE